MLLYHYTAIDAYQWILEDGFIKLSPSNLKPPHRATACIKEDPKRRIRYYWDKWNDYKPVVWLTSDNTLQAPSTDGVNDLNNAGLYRQKMGVCIAVEYDPHKHMKWTRFADINHMDWEYRKQFTSGYNYESWYIARQPIPVSEIVSVTFSPEYDDRIAEYLLQKERSEITEREAQCI